MVTKERQALEVEVEAHTNTQASVNKAVRNLNKVHTTQRQPDKGLVLTPLSVTLYVIVCNVWSRLRLVW